jgi:hypothetical protein
VSPGFGFAGVGVRRTVTVPFVRDDLTVAPASGTPAVDGLDASRASDTETKEPDVAARAVERVSPVVRRFELDIAYLLRR